MSNVSVQVTLNPNRWGRLCGEQEELLGASCTSAPKPAWTLMLCRVYSGSGTQEPSPPTRALLIATRTLWIALFRFHCPLVVCLHGRQDLKAWLARYLGVRLRSSARTRARGFDSGHTPASPRFFICERAYFSSTLGPGPQRIGSALLRLTFFVSRCERVRLASLLFSKQGVCLPLDWDARHASLVQRAAER